MLSKESENMAFKGDYRKLFKASAGAIVAGENYAWV